MKVAAIQMCSSHVLDENLEVTGKMIQEAAGNSAKLVVLPEMFAMMGFNAVEDCAIKEPMGDGKIQHFLADIASKNKVWVVGGTIPIACDDKKRFRAASLVFNDQGKIVARYDKIHLFDVTLSKREFYKESDTTEPGDKIVVVDTSIGRLGLAICYDIRFPELFRSLVVKGAEIIALPAAFTVKTGKAHWELLTRSRAIENFCYLIGACQTGVHTNRRKTYGGSLIVDPWGKVVRINSKVAGIVYSEIDLKYLYQVRRTIPALNHKKLCFINPLE